MPSFKRRGAAATAFVLASTTSLAGSATASPAAANTHHAPAYYAGQAQGNVLGINIKLPVKLASLPNPLGVNLIHLEGKAVHDPLHLAGKTPAVAESTASLITGSLANTLARTLHVTLNRTAHVQLGGASHQQNSLLSIPAKPLADLEVGSLIADLTKSTQATSSGAHGVVANIGTGNDLLGAQTVAKIQALLDQVNAVGTVQDTVDQILSTLQTITGKTPVVGETVKSLKKTVNTILGKVNNLVDHLGTTPLVQISVHDTDQSVTPFASGVKSTSTMGLVDVNVLGGLLKINGFHSQAMAFANGKPGGARTISSATKPLVSVNAADALCAQLSSNGISLCNVDNLGLPASVTKQLNALLKQLSTELNQITAQILDGVPLVSETAGSQHVSKDGRSATAVAPAYNIAVGKLLTVTLGSGVSASAAAIQKAQKRHVVILHNPENTPHSLPFTGLNMGELAVIALSLLVVAAVIRRRLMSAGNGA
jgi:hypothetical protein